MHLTWVLTAGGFFSLDFLQVSLCRFLLFAFRSLNPYSWSCHLGRKKETDWTHSPCVWLWFHALVIIMTIITQEEQKQESKRSQEALFTDQAWNRASERVRDGDEEEDEGWDDGDEFWVQLESFSLSLSLSLSLFLSYEKVRKVQQVNAFFPLTRVTGDKARKRERERIKCNLLVCSLSSSLLLLLFLRGGRDTHAKGTQTHTHKHKMHLVR